MKRSTFLASLAAVVLATATSGCGYNQIQSLDERVNAAKGQIETQLQRRSDLVPNLVETVKGFAKQEQAVFGQIAEARARLGGAIQSGDVQQMSQANSELSSALGRLLVVVENYPDLKSNQNFLNLQEQLEGTENRIAVARTDYNNAVNEYNAYIRRFPTNLTAKMFGAEQRPYFEAEAGAREVPKVSF
jgi:LemA protein